MICMYLDMQFVCESQFLFYPNGIRLSRVFGKKQSYLVFGFSEEFLTPAIYPRPVNQRQMRVWHLSGAVS